MANKLLRNLTAKGLCLYLPGLYLLVLCAPQAWTAQGVKYREPPAISAQVRAQALPPIEERIPLEPAVAAIEAHGGRIGQYGGVLRMLISRLKDVRMIKVYGYARLVAYDPDYTLQPDILKEYEVREGRIFTLRLRRGHKWSDGYPFTSEDFRYYWEDIASNSEISRAGPLRALLVDGEEPIFEVLDDTTVRYTWKKPNPYFLQALARPLPLGIYRPAHYLKNFHARYADPEILDLLVKSYRRRNWVALHYKLGQYSNPELPTLQPWISMTALPANRFEGERNPYFHRVDRLGQQLPYIDRLILTLTGARLIPARAGAGEVDLQARGLNFSDFTFLKLGERHNNYNVRLWREGRGSHLALYPNLNVNDPVWRRLFRDMRFRRALSLAIDRGEINQIFFYGLCEEGNNSVLPQSQLYRPGYREAWAQFDLARASRLLDEIGLVERNSEGIRLLPDGRPLEIIVETPGESPLQSDILQLIGDSWRKAGIKLFAKHSQREVFRLRIFSGQTHMSLWYGLENGMATDRSDPWEFAPVAQVSLQWPKWGQYYETKGQAGVPVDMPVAAQLMRLYRDWQRARSPQQRRQAWHAMLRIHQDQVFTIGLVGAVFQPVVVNNRLVNVPEQGVYNWDPGSHFGVYRPDTFWYRDDTSRTADLRR